MDRGQDSMTRNDTGASNNVRSFIAKPRYFTFLNRTVGVASPLGPACFHLVRDLLVWIDL